MYINFEEVRNGNNVDGKHNVDVCDYSFSNPLVLKVDNIICSYSCYIVDEDLFLNIKVGYDVEYSDANTLKPINMVLDFEEEVCFTVNEKRAEELDIDCINEPVNLDNLILALINVDIPFNYSNEKVETSMANNDSYNPFSNIF